MATVLPQTHQIQRYTAYFSLTKFYSSSCREKQLSGGKYLLLHFISITSHHKKAMMSGFGVRPVLEACCFTAIQNDTQTALFSISVQRHRYCF